MHQKEAREASKECSGLQKLGLLGEMLLVPPEPLH